MKIKTIVWVSLLCWGAGTAAVRAEPSGPGVQSPGSAWQGWFARQFKRKPPLPESPGSSRGRICLVSPHPFAEGGALWQRPILLWQGRVAKVGLRQVGAAELLWSQSVGFDSEALIQSVRYNGPPLEPGVKYEWGTFEFSSDPDPQLFHEFEVMGPEERGPITRAWLQELVVLQRAGTTSVDWMQRRVEFLLEQGLAADAYQSLFLAAVQGRLDEEGKARVQEAAEDFCYRR